MHFENPQDDADGASVESSTVQIGNNQVTTYHSFGDDLFLNSVDDSISENPINLQGETPEQLADFITKQAMDTLLPILRKC